MESSNTDVSTSSTRRAAFANRLKPRLGARAQYVLAGTVWYVVAVVLGTRGVRWLLGSQWGIVLAAVGVALGLLKARYIMARVASHAVERIHERDRSECAGGFFSWQSWLVVLVMMGAGFAVRMTSTPRPILGGLYVAIATGLLFGGRLYWLAAFRETR